MNQIKKVEIKPDSYVWIDNDLQITDVRFYKDRWVLENGDILEKLPIYLSDLSYCKLIVAASPDLNLDGVPTYEQYSSKQSSVEWLYDELFNSFQKFIALKLTTEEYIVNNLKLLKQAKERYKEEIIKSNRDGVDMCVNNDKFITGQEYYDKIFNK